MPRWNQGRYGASSRTGARRGRAASASRPYPMKRKRLPSRARAPSNALVIPRSVNFHSGMPKRIAVKLRYTDIFTFDGTTVAARNTFRANSLFDPDYTGTGHQPYYFDQWATMYNNYTVTGCHVRVQFVATTASPPTDGSITNSMCAVRWLLDPTADNSLDTSQIGERPDCIVKALSHQGPPVVIEMYRAVANTFGVTPVQVLTDAQFTGSVGANPATSNYIAVTCQGSTQGITSNACNIYVTLTYYAQLFTLICPAQS